MQYAAKSLSTRTTNPPPQKKKIYIYNFVNRIVENFGFVHLSAGDLLRAERKAPGSEVDNL